MITICEHLEGIVVYQDDILVFGDTADELKDRVQCLLKRLRKRNVQINWDKSIRQCTEVTFLGHQISRKGIAADPKLINKIREIKPPRCLKDLQHFLGLVNFYSTKINSYSSKCLPLNALRKKGTPFVWTTKQQQAFERLKEDIASDSVVRAYCLNKEVTLTCDASEKAIGAVLSQEGSPVMYLSRTLSQAEQRYSNIEREALAIVWSVKRAEKFLLGRTFTIQTDHSPLEHIFGDKKGIPKVTSARLQRWAISLMLYDYHIQYTPASHIPQADALSRLEFEDAKKEVNVIYEELELGVHYCFNEKVSWLDLVQETELDPVLVQVKQRIAKDDWLNCSPMIAKYKKNKDFLSVENEVVVLGSRPTIPAKLRHKILATAHDAHFGMSTTKLSLKRNVWWPGMDKDVEHFVAQCPECAKKSKPNTQSQLFTWKSSSVPFERVHIDWAHIPKFGEFLVLVDACLGWPEVHHCINRPQKL
jgi:hypothetical protein